LLQITNVVDIQKQSEDLRKLELQFKLSDNYKLEIENHGSEIEILRLKIELEKEKKQNR
jgi:hypothetical protein